MNHGNKAVAGVLLRYICQPCPECKAKLELFARYKSELEGLTPGGSEYVDDPERCATVIRDRFAGPIALLKRQKAKLEAAEEMARALESFLLCQAADGTKCAPNNSDFIQGRAALSAWEKAGKGKL